MGSSPHEQVPGSSIPPFRLDVQLHELLRPTSEPIRPPAPPEEGLELPELVFRSVLSCSVRSRTTK